MSAETPSTSCSAPEKEVVETVPESAEDPNQNGWFLNFLLPKMPVGFSSDYCGAYYGGARANAHHMSALSGENRHQHQKESGHKNSSVCPHSLSCGVSGFFG